MDHRLDIYFDQSNGRSGRVECKFRQVGSGDKKLTSLISGLPAPALPAPTQKVTWRPSFPSNSN